MKVIKESEIKFSVGTDENNVPEKIEWFASAENTGGPCKAIMLSLWDEKDKNTLRI
ncbi:MAG: gliding motility protein GldC, partial [Bacteroidota bacterium]